MANEKYKFYKPIDGKHELVENDGLPDLESCKICCFFNGDMLEDDWCNVELRSCGMLEGHYEEVDK